MQTTAKYSKGKTYITQRFPWGFYTPYGHRLLCSDGVIRAAKLSTTADTFFCVPASIRIKGKTISGYMTVEESFKPDYKIDATVYAFRHHTVHQDKLPVWPARYTQEHTELLATTKEKP